MDRLRPNDPETIGPYKLIARLGAGGMGVVFLGTKGVDRAAIKVVRSTFLDDPSLNTRFFREIDTLKKIDSPYVAKIVDSSMDEDFAWHAVEFINGPTLRELIDTNGPLPEDAWWKLAQQLGEALNSVHALGIIHRDIKPANIIMSDTGPKVIDFGIAQDSDATSLTTTGAVAGSPAWLSPEQLEGTDITPGSDLYSLGSVLVFAATGRSPWGDETSMSVPVVYQKILSGQPNLDGLSARQKTLVEGLQNSDPSTRSLPENWRQSRPVETKIIPHTGTKTTAKQPSPPPPPPSATTKPNHPSTKKLLRGEEFNPQEHTALARIKFRLRGHPELSPGVIATLLILVVIFSAIGVSHSITRAPQDNAERGSAETWQFESDDDEWEDYYRNRGQALDQEAACKQADSYALEVFDAVGRVNEAFDADDESSRLYWLNQVVEITDEASELNIVDSEIQETWRQWTTKWAEIAHAWLQSDWSLDSEAWEVEYLRIDDKLFSASGLCAEWID